MIVLLVFILVCMALWYVIFIVFGVDGHRDVRSLLRRAPSQPPAASPADPAHTQSLNWTALDDQQLTRLLKGSAP